MDERKNFIVEMISLEVFIEDVKEDCNKNKKIDDNEKSENRVNVKYEDLVKKIKMEENMKNRIEVLKCDKKDVKNIKNDGYKMSLGLVKVKEKKKW
jgi:hypothetical protein